MRINLSILGNWLLILIVLYFSYQIFTTSNSWIFLDNINLLIHEAGHLIFMPFGKFINILSGSLFQILFPFSFLVYFFNIKKYFSASFILFWIAENIINVSVYMRDAQAMQLPLLGGENVIHDWNWLFNSMGVLYQTQVIGNAFFVLGIIFLITSIICMILFTILNMKNINVLQ